ncbi:hypothetical protein LCGC14_1493330 [marine sediment metagenome]|uniref:Uncharacterized protein n=1 Tax=marine sediment metagenome TaxID=412755 RepID=A0A0F9J641_9ZZZZ
MTDPLAWQDFFEKAQRDCELDPARAFARWGDQPSKEEWAAQYALALLEQAIRQDGTPMPKYHCEEIAENARKMANMIFGEEKPDE